jgi:hypothetical protein
LETGLLSVELVQARSDVCRADALPSDPLYRVWFGAIGYLYDQGIRLPVRIRLHPARMRYLFHPMCDSVFRDWLQRQGWNPGVHGLIIHRKSRFRIWTGTGFSKRALPLPGNLLEVSSSRGDTIACLIRPPIDEGCQHHIPPRIKDHRGG